MPPDRCSLECGSLIANGRQILTPPRSLMTDSNPVKFSSMKWSSRMCVVCSIVFHRHPGPPSANVALICSTDPGAAAWPGDPGTCGQCSTGTTESRGMLITTARFSPGDRCSTRMVSDRCPLMCAPNLSFLPFLESDPITRMFSELLYLGGRLPRSLTDT